MANACERTWPGRLVICLQLLSWCAVGALLLHRGFMTVKETEVIKLSNTTTNNDSYSQTRNQSEQIGNDMIVGEPTLDYNGKIAAKSDVNEKVNKLIETESGNESKFTTKVINTYDNIENTQTVNNSVSKSTPSTETTPTHVHNVRVPPPSSTATKQRRYDLTPSGVVMAALGIVMLVIGPSVVILRCCDSGRQDSRFDKLTDEDRARELAARDLPPSYEDVAGRVPRYSMLFPDDQDTSVV